MSEHTPSDTTLNFCGHLYSEPVVHKAEDGTLTLEWVHRGRTGTTLVADPLIEEWAATGNEVVALRSALQEAREQVEFLRNAHDKGAELDAAYLAEVERLRAALTAARSLAGRLWCDDRPDDSTMTAIEAWLRALPPAELAELDTEVGVFEDFPALAAGSGVPQQTEDGA